ncbi:GTP-binding domain protein [Aphelenchoides fujianensis]|nr:GTP-binding domain protein [Aphelenchoides fujianensis]
MKTPLRSQSFRHRARPQLELRRYALEEVTSERRRSTPTVSRRCSLQKTRQDVARTDVWPEPKPMSEVEERFLKLPDSDDYTRVRQFRIDAKGAVVSRGDSFRRKRAAAASLNANRKQEASPSPFPTSDPESRPPSDSRSPSIDSELSVAKSQQPTTDSDEPSTSHNSCYKIYVLGANGAGKSSLISQFITSEYRNAFADEIEDYENTVSINIGGQECDLIFFEADPTVGDEWKNVPDIQAYVLVYSIDRKSSFRAVTNVLEDLRQDGNQIPVILAGNKVDLERKRAVLSSDVKNVASTFGVARFEISVALNHDVDDLLIAIVAEIKESFKIARNTDENRPIATRSESVPENKPDEAFHAAIRRFSQRKKRQLGAAAAGVDLDNKCTNLSPTTIFERFRRAFGHSPKC